MFNLTIGLCLLGTVSISSILFTGFDRTVFAQTEEAPESSETIDETIEEPDTEEPTVEERPLSEFIEPLEVCWLEENPQEQDGCSSEVTVITRDTISQTELTVPSLWWAEEQLSDRFGTKLLNNWLAYPELRRVDLIVNRQQWAILDYLQRYAFVNQMGTVVRADRYNLRVFNSREPERPLATYTCNFDLNSSVDPIRDATCEIEINSGARPTIEEEPDKRSGEDLPL
ncbi:MAG: hypothetical protein SWY16_23255 [Cyanobacteriota bacterium]|nr:hypothetical protein [Cyanobacteriota bacterium]